VPSETGSGSVSSSWLGRWLLFVFKRANFERE
jgi:hypothetical protein